MRVQHAFGVKRSSIWATTAMRQQLNVEWDSIDSLQQSKVFSQILVICNGQGSYYQQDKREKWEWTVAAFNQTLPWSWIQGFLNPKWNEKRLQKWQNEGVKHLASSKGWGGCHHESASFQDLNITNIMFLVGHVLVV